MTGAQGSQRRRDQDEPNSLRTARIAAVMLWLDKRRQKAGRRGSGLALHVVNWAFWRSVEADVRAAEQRGEARL